MNKYTCEYCGQEIDENEAGYYDGKILCESCWNEHIITCCCCGEPFEKGDKELTEISEGFYVCPRCEDKYAKCDECGNFHAKNEMWYLDGKYICRDCGAGCLEGIEPYSHKPTPIFYGDSGGVYMGVELEIDKGGEVDENANAIRRIANKKGAVRLYTKHDGSIDEGFEIVSHPMTLEYHKETMPWKEILNKAKSMGYMSHKTKTCGLHIHVGRAGLGEEDATIGRIVYFFENFWNELVKFSRRSSESLDRWAARYLTKSNRVRKTYDDAKDKAGGLGRYVAVNLSNEDTVEFRMFRGTLKYNTFIATLELINHICTLMRDMDDDEVEALSWNSFCETIPKDNKELILYLKSKNLYINEEEDI